MNPWYAKLNRPPLTPPDWVFPPVWAALYISIAVAIVLYYRSPSKPQVWLTTVILLIHLFTNLIWTYLFFGLRSPGCALTDIVLLDLSLIAVIMLFCRVNAVAGVVLIPYLLWVLFATYLNYGFYTLN